VITQESSLMVKMGRLSEAVFGRKDLPSRCLVFPGAYSSMRKEWIRSLFDKWERLQGGLVKYAFAYKGANEYLLVFNIYGASMMLEVIELLKEGETNSVFFIGSVGSRDLPVGTIVLPTKIFDQTGFVTLDVPAKQILKPNVLMIEKLRAILYRQKVGFVEGKIVSVPCVFHGIDQVSDFIEKTPRILGVECEASTFFHYSNKASLESYALLYVSDNRKNDIISDDEALRSKRKSALTIITRIATEVFT
jgi:purine-nucleoside phosphorylase